MNCGDLLTSEPAPVEHGIDVSAMIFDVHALCVRDAPSMYQALARSVLIGAIVRPVFDDRKDRRFNRIRSCVTALCPVA